MLVRVAESLAAAAASAEAAERGAGDGDEQMESHRAGGEESWLADSLGRRDASAGGPPTSAALWLALRQMLESPLGVSYRLLLPAAAHAAARAAAQPLPPWLTAALAEKDPGALLRTLLSAGATVAAGEAALQLLRGAAARGVSQRCAPASSATPVGAVEAVLAALRRSAAEGAGEAGALAATLEAEAAAGLRRTKEDEAALRSVSASFV